MARRLDYALSAPAIQIPRYQHVNKGGARVRQVGDPGRDMSSSRSHFEWVEMWGPLVQPLPFDSRLDHRLDAKEHEQNMDNALG